MTEEENKWQQVENYLEGRMDASERAAFETAMANDPLLSAMVEASQLATEVVISHETLKLKEQMAKDLAHPKPNITLYLLFPLVVIAIGIGAHFYFQSNAEKTEKPSLLVPKTIQVQETKPGQQISSVQTEKTRPTSPLPTKVESTPLPQGEVSTPTPVSESIPVSVSISKEALYTPTPAAKEEVSPTNSLPKEIPKDKCASIKIELQYITQPTCLNQNTGELLVKTETVKGGTAPYAFSLAADKEFVSHELRNLKEGTYTLYVKDAHHCVVAYAQPIVVHKIACETPKEYSYNPAFDGAWKIPYDEDKKAVSVKIIDKGGREVYSSHVQGGSPAEWNGESNTGSAIGVGYHTFLIEYSDGTVDKGAITILR